MASLPGEAVDTNVDCTVVGYSFRNKNDEFKKKKKKKKKEMFFEAQTSCWRSIWR